jgi:hypothetical protein
LVDGSTGCVPTPIAGTQNSVLTGAGTWVGPQYYYAGLVGLQPINVPFTFNTSISNQGSFINKTTINGGSSFSLSASFDYIYKISLYLNYNNIFNQNLNTTITLYNNGIAFYSLDVFFTSTSILPVYLCAYITPIVTANITVMKSDSNTYTNIIEGFISIELLK